MKKKIHVFVYGIVQGVGYRYFAYKWAKRLGINGFVRNLSDGRVEVIGEGDEETLKAFLEKLEQGPFGAVVEKVDVKWEETEGKYNDFNIY
ncbi:MAG: acylphosphatase [Dictyoglomus sp. NZ13-RE01]|nr:MAG: acylphosphatase [Dictyoglomus sp. NZ13-RE01]